MPMAKYYLVHWGSSLTDAKKEILLDWVKKHRAEHYPNNLSATVFANEPIQPIADSIPVDIRKVALGEMLYNDPRLSSDNTVSCASCHNLQTGGVDNKAYSGRSGQATRRRQRPDRVQCRLQLRAVLGRPGGGSCRTGRRPAVEPGRNGQRVVGRNHREIENGQNLYERFHRRLPGRLLGRNHHGRHRRIRKNAAHARFAVRPLPERRFDGVERGGVFTDTNFSKRTAARPVTSARRSADSPTN